MIKQHQLQSTKLDYTELVYIVIVDRSHEKDQNQQSEYSKLDIHVVFSRLHLTYIILLEQMFINPQLTINPNK